MKLIEFETPAIWTPNMDDEEREFELDRMLARSLATKDWLEGRLNTADWMDCMDYYGVDILQAAQDWNQGISYI
ncbi:MAG: hypothetical protein ACFB4I_17525 [Cyanophyceae cyanobacterium]